MLRLSTTPSTGDSTRMSGTTSRRAAMSCSCELETPKIRSSSAMRSIGPAPPPATCPRGCDCGCGWGCVTAMR